MKQTWRAITILLVVSGLGIACESSGENSSSQPGADGAVPSSSPDGETPAVAEVGPSSTPAASAPDEPPQGDDAVAEADEDKTVLILGSSLAATGFGALLEDQLQAHPKVTCHRKAKSATGLARPDFYDWNETAAREIAERKPDLTVVVMGGNDGQGLIPKGEGKRVNWETEGWESAYRERVDAFLEVLTADGGKVLWLGIPRTNTHKLEAKLRTIRKVHREAAAANQHTEYLEMTKFVENEAGELMRDAEVRGKRYTIRGDDGVHFTMSGSRYLADLVYPEVLAAMGVPEVVEEPEPEPDPEPADEPTD